MTPDEIKAELAKYEKEQARIVGLCVWREARGEEQKAKFAVARAIRNRCSMAPAQGFKFTASANVLKPFAFSSFNAGDPNSTKFPVETDPVWQQCIAAARSAFGLMQNDVTGGAVFYHDSTLDGPPHAWGPVELTVKIGRLSFYKIGRAA